MKHRTLATVCALALISEAALTGALITSASARHALRPATAGTREQAALSSHGRLFLSADQVTQALRNQIIDRPIKSLLAVSSPLHYGDYIWNEVAVPPGTTWVRVDLRSQLISIFRAGHEIGTAVIVYGGDNKQTPLGNLHILGKAKEHRSSLYEASMPYTLRLTGDGVSIHGSSVRWGSATHGCIGVPLGFARKLFGATHIGDEVVVIRSSQPS